MQNYQPENIFVFSFRINIYNQTGKRNNRKERTMNLTK